MSAVMEETNSIGCNEARDNFNALLSRTFGGIDPTMYSLRLTLWNEGYERYHALCNVSCDDSLFDKQKDEIAEFYNERCELALAATISWLKLRGCICVRESFGGNDFILLSPSMDEEDLGNLHLNAGHKKIIGERPRDLSRGYLVIGQYSDQELQQNPDLFLQEVKLIKMFVERNVADNMQPSLLKKLNGILGKEGLRPKLG